jgi:hypothetical protein
VEVAGWSLLLPGSGGARGVEMERAIGEWRVSVELTQNLGDCVDEVVDMGVVHR